MVCWGVLSCSLGQEDLQEAGSQGPKVKGRGFSGLGLCDWLLSVSCSWVAGRGQGQQAGTEQVLSLSRHFHTHLQKCRQEDTH